MLNRQIFQDIKHHRLSSWAIITAIMLACLLTASATIVARQLWSSSEAFLDKAQSPHIIQMHTGDLQAEDIRAFVQDQDQVTDYQIIEFLNLDSQLFTFGQESLSHSIQDNGVVSQSPNFDYLLDLNNSIINVQKGEVYIPLSYAELIDLDKYDHMQIGGKDFKIAGFLRDVQMNSTLSSSKRFLIHEEDFQDLVPRGQMEYLIEFQVAQEAAISQVENAYLKAGLPANGPTISYPLIRLVNMMTDGIKVFLLLLISLLMLAISFLLIRLTLITQLENDLDQIAHLKAIGFRNSDLTRLYRRKYLYLSLFAAFLACLLALGLAPCLLRDIQIYMGGEIRVVNLALLSFLSVLILILFVMTYVAWILRRVKQIHPSGEPIHEKVQTYKYKGAGPGLKQGKYLSTSFILAINQILKHLPVFIAYGLIIALSLSIVVTPYNLGHTLQSPAFMSYMGLGKSHVLITLPQSEDLGQAGLALYKELLQDDSVAKAALTYETNYLTSDGIRLKVTMGDQETVPVNYLEGSYPQSDQEIALSSLLAQDLELGLGDKLELVIKDQLVILEVCGLYADLTNGGKTSKVAFTDPQAPLMKASINVVLEDEALSPDFISKLQVISPNLILADTQTYAQQIFAGTLDTVKLISLLALASSLLLVGVISWLVVRLMLVSSQTDLDLQYALGFRLQDLHDQYRYQIMIPALLALLVGNVLAHDLGQDIIGTMMASLGGGGFRFIINPWVSGLLIPLIFIICIYLAHRIGLKSIPRKGVT